MRDWNFRKNQEIDFFSKMSKIYQFKSLVSFTTVQASSWWPSTIYLVAIVLGKRLVVNHPSLRLRPTSSSTLASYQWNRRWWRLVERKVWWIWLSFRRSRCLRKGWKKKKKRLELIITSILLELSPELYKLSFWNISLAKHSFKQVSS